MNDNIVETCERMTKEQRQRRAALSECCKALGGACAVCSLRNVSGCEGSRCSVWRVQEAIDAVRRKWSRRCRDSSHWVDHWAVDEFETKTKGKGATA